MAPESHVAIRFLAFCTRFVLTGGGVLLFWQNVILHFGFPRARFVSAPFAKYRSQAANLGDICTHCVLGITAHTGENQTYVGNKSGSH